MSLLCSDSALLPPYNRVTKSYLHLFGDDSLWQNNGLSQFHLM